MFLQLRAQRANHDILVLETETETVTTVVQAAQARSAGKARINQVQLGTAALGQRRQ